MSYFIFDPTVYLIGQSYQIVFHTTEPGFGWVMLNGVRYTDSSAGLMRSDRAVHKVTVPADILDRTGSYTVVYQQMLDRRPYWPVRGEIEEKTYSFRAPRCENGFNFFQIADTHCRINEAAEAALTHGGELDFLLLNGDINECSDSLENFHIIARAASQVTHGQIPVVYARGNHDTRGHLATDLLNYIPTDGEKTYFTFRTGSLWGIVLDCGEDKKDISEEYGGVADFTPFRQAETRWLEDVLARANEEFAADGVKYRIAICHVPFTENLGRGNAIFGIDQDIYARWTALCNQMNLDALICGHMHACYSTLPGGEQDFYGQSFPVVVASRPNAKREDGTVYFTGLSVHADGSAVSAEVVTTDAGKEKKLL